MRLRRRKVRKERRGIGEKSEKFQAALERTGCNPLSMSLRTTRNQDLPIMKGEAFGRNVKIVIAI